MSEKIEYEIILPRLDDYIEFHLGEEELKKEMKAAFPQGESFEIIPTLRNMEIRGTERLVWVIVIRVIYDEGT